MLEPSVANWLPQKPRKGLEMTLGRGVEKGAKSPTNETGGEVGHGEWEAEKKERKSPASAHTFELNSRFFLLSEHLCRPSQRLFAH
jgi:hypothetical protein